MQYQNYPQYLRHPLFRALRAAVMARAENVCEECKARPATEVHHLKYPIWGSFDTIDHMRAICHECHCEEHEVER